MKNRCGCGPDQLQLDVSQGSTAATLPNHKHPHSQLVPTNLFALTKVSLAVLVTT